jgi:prepilin-type N-terminal cleavage/methylation domain-containing protein
MKRESGFTLLEVLMALTVMAVGVTLTLSLISGSLGNLRKVRGTATIVEHAQAAMEVALLDDLIQGAASRQGDFEDGTRWSVDVTEIEMPVPPSALPLSQQITSTAPKLLSFVVVVTGPNSTKADFQLQTMKLISPVPLVQGGRVTR